jgi:hypothetical protein
MPTIAGGLTQGEARPSNRFNVPFFDSSSPNCVPKVIFSLLMSLSIQAEIEIQFFAELLMRCNCAFYEN